MDLSDWVEEAE